MVEQTRNKPPQQNIIELNTIEYNTIEISLYNRVHFMERTPLTNRINEI